MSSGYAGCDEGRAGAARSGKECWNSGKSENALIWRHLIPVLVVVVMTQASESGPAPTPDVTGCSRGGFVLGADYSASITTFQCESRVVLELKQVVEFRKPVPLTVSRDFLVIQTNQETEWVSGCLGEALHYSDIVVVLRLPLDRRHPEVLRAWKVNRETWEFEELDDTNIECRLMPPSNCARDRAI